MSMLLNLFIERRLCVVNNKLFFKTLNKNHVFTLTLKRRRFSFSIDGSGELCTSGKCSYDEEECVSWLKLVSMNAAIASIVTGPEAN